MAGAADPGCEPGGANLVSSSHIRAMLRQAQASDAVALSQPFGETEPGSGMGFGESETREALSAVQARRETDIAMR
jgi:hypothetical protein